MRMSTRRRKNIIIAVLIVMVIGMTIAFSALSSYLTINGTSSITSDFKVVFTNIEEGTMNSATTVNKEITDPTTATFQVDLKKPGSRAEYNVTVQNQGKLNAYLESIEGIDEANNKAPTDIKFKISGITRYTKLAVNETITFKVIVTFDSLATSLPEESKQLTLRLNFSQDSGNAPEPESETQTVTEVTDALLSSGTTYNYLGGTYLGGAQDSNYVWFNGFMWRIMGKNADGSIRMITEEGLTVMLWGAENTAEDYDNSYVNDWLNNYFYPKLKDKEMLVKQTWCSETTTDIASVRTTCTNNLSKAPQYVGLISLDEYNLAGKQSSYLVNSQSFWTLTPYSKSNIYYSFNRTSSISVSSVRPIINLNSNIIINNGDGTINNPYLIKDSVDNIAGTLKDNSQIGEYVTYAGRNYRVVETSSNGTKLILDGYYDSNNDGIIEEVDKFDYNFDEQIVECALCTKINSEEFINWISNNSDVEKQKLESVTWYRGKYYNWGDNYQKLYNSINPYDGKIGVIRMGEILAAQSETMISKNHTTQNNSANLQNYWTSSKPNSLNTWYIDNMSSAHFQKKLLAIRPVINIGPDVQITSGNGTPNSPYQI